VNRRTAGGRPWPTERPRPEQAGLSPPRASGFPATAAVKKAPPPTARHASAVVQWLEFMHGTPRLPCSAALTGTGVI